MQSSLISQGLDLLVYGMGTVFTFLVLLVCVTSLMSKVVNRFFPEAVLDTELSVVTEISDTETQQAVEPRIVKIIQAALDKHRNR